MSKSTSKFLLTTFLIIASLSQTAHAGYTIKHNKITQNRYTNTQTGSIVPVTLSGYTHNHINPNQQIEDENETQRTRNKRRSTSGWEGTASLYCAIFGLLVFPPGLIAAIILGALGLGEGKKHRGRAIAGLIIGITSVFLVATLLVLLA
jgi:hypothetical protein